MPQGRIIGRGLAIFAAANYPRYGRGTSSCCSMLRWGCEMRNRGRGSNEIRMTLLGLSVDRIAG